MDVLRRMVQQRPKYYELKETLQRGSKIETRFRNSEFVSQLDTEYKATTALQWCIHSSSFLMKISKPF